MGKGGGYVCMEERTLFAQKRAQRYSALMKALSAWRSKLFSPKKMTAYISDTVMLMNYICIVAIVSALSTSALSYIINIPVN